MTDDTSPKLFASLKTLAGTVVSMLQTRLELASVELAEEKERLLGTAFLGMLGISLIALTIMTLTALVVILCWDTYRWQSLAIMAALYGLGALACLWKVRSLLRSAPPLFEATLAELDKDREILRQ
ncbi:phage holin family protein [Ralstonia soli]|uniref:Phage holin family protein n=1 Tax=Ralstonia soli TaxID=2953896 RepID=A0ABT1AJA0_9RALS|nr:phage holin family protein [Ralstonia soli]MCO5398396.1 phage holin family protein [Ralstonia soli]